MQSFQAARRQGAFQYVWQAPVITDVYNGAKSQHVEASYVGDSKRDVSS